MNLPTRIYDGRIHTELSYLPSTLETTTSKNVQKNTTSSLVERRIERDQSKILKREFYEYDQTAGASLYIIDDGLGIEKDDLTGVHRRLINRSINKCDFFAGLPLVVTSSGWDSKKQKELLIQKTEFEYDKHGHITLEKHYDSENYLAYTIYKTHDIQGNTLYETDPLGQATRRVFNKYRCLLHEQGPSPTFYTEFTYDLLQRPISSTKTYADGLKLSTHTSYNLQGNPLKEIGIYGEASIKKYNNQHLLQVLIEPPLRLDYGEWISPQTKYTYDLMGNVTTEECLGGSQTVYQYSTLGKPLSIQFPDGRTEYFSYSIYGELIKKTAPNGTNTFYTYDSLGRVLTEASYDIDGVELKLHKYIYEGANLVKEEEGALTTTYAYDHAGRIIQKQVGSNCVEYGYDSLGRQIEEKVYYGYGSEDYISTIKTYDLLNRIIEEKSVDSTEKFIAQPSKHTMNLVM